MLINGSAASSEGQHIACTSLGFSCFLFEHGGKVLLPVCTLFITSRYPKEFAQHQLLGSTVLNSLTVKML